MHTIQENTTLVGVTELRSKMKDVLKALKTSKVILELRNKPLAVLLPFERYQKIEELLETLEDRALGYLAREREKSHRESEYPRLEDVEKRLGHR